MPSADDKSRRTGFAASIEAMTRSLGALVGACLLTLLLVVPAAAHAELEESDPADGETITTPYTLTATFSEDFSPDPNLSYIRVQNADGDVVASGGHDDQGATMSVELPALPPGEYTVFWQTTTVDDNGAERDTFTFSVEASATPAPTGTSQPTEAPGVTSPPTTPTTATPAPTQILTPTPSGQAGTGASGGGTDVLLALAAGIAIVGVLAYFLVRRSRT
jgi:methionine-rich copper-binding protein CopC